MGVDVLQSKKEEVAQSMFNDFKDELNFFQSTILGFFDKKITQTITSNVQIGTSLEDAKLHMNFFEKLLSQLSPSTTEKLLLFIKEKQEQLVKANTIEELDNLKKGIIVPPPLQPESQLQMNSNMGNDQAPKDIEQQDKDDSSKKINNIVAGVTVGGGLGLSVLATEQIYKLQQKNKIASSIDIKNIDAQGLSTRLKEQFSLVSEELEEESKNFKLLKVQKNMMKKSAKEFEKIAKSLDKDTFTAVDMLYKLENKLPQSLLKSIEPDDAAKLGKLISEDGDLAAELAKKGEKNIEKIMELLQNKGIKNINKEVVQAMKAMNGIEELKSMAFVLTNTKGIKAFMKGIRSIAFLDLISTGFDVWVLREGLDEAEMYEQLNAVRASTAKEHQWIQFGASLASTAISIIATCATIGSAGGPIGTAVGAVLGVASFAASQAIDIYYDAVEFHLQNEADFKSQYRTEIKQAIIQSAGSEAFDLNINARLTAIQKKAGYSRTDRNLFPFSITLTEKDRLTTTEDAWKSLIRQEEYKNFPLIQQGFGSGKVEQEFIATLSPTDQQRFKDQQKELTIIIDKRMEYVKRYMYENKDSKEYLAFVSAMKNNIGIKAIEQILANSKTYYSMSQTGTEQYIVGAKNITEYKQKFGEKLKTEFPEGFATLENMWLQKPYAVEELSIGVKNFENIFINSKKNPDYVYTDKIPQIEKNISFLKKYIEYKKLSLPIEEQQKLDIPLRAIDMNMIENILIEGRFGDIGAIAFNSEKAKLYFTRNRIAERVDAKIEVSDSIGQNIIYRIAKEIHGYQGNNDRKELMEFFREDKGSALGMYYSDGWKINNDRAIDKSIKIDDMDKMKADDIMNMRLKPSWQNTVLAAAFDPIETIKASLLPGSGIFMSQSLFGLRDDAAPLDTKADAGDMDKKMNTEYWSRLRTIVYEEKGYASPEGKKIVEEYIIDYIKKYSKSVYKADQSNGEPDVSLGQELGYVELPYYLIMAAKKAKIGNMENFIYKYQDDKIVACTSYTHSNDVLNFSETKAVVSKEYISIGQQIEYKQAMPYIMYVDKAREKFSDLINSNDNDLDIPPEYKKIYEDKINDRERYTSDLIGMNPELAKIKLLSDYQSYHDRFENMYTAILLKISKFSVSNDIDDAQYLQEIENRANQISAITIENGIIKGSTAILSDNQNKLLYIALNERKPRDKDILTLAKSPDPEDGNKAIRAIKQIVKSIMEAQVVNFDENGSIANVVNGTSKGFEYKFLDKEPMRREKIKALVKERLSINGNPASYFVPPSIDIPKIDDSKIQIIPVK